jgi:hypothetical protein
VPTFATTFAVPAATPVASPELAIESAVGLLLDQVIDELGIVAVEPSEYAPIAENCSVVPATTLFAFPGDAK